jgi:hypothetical protein
MQVAPGETVTIQAGGSWSYGTWAVNFDTAGWCQVQGLGQSFVNDGGQDACEADGSVIDHQSMCRWQLDGSTYPGDVWISNDRKCVGVPVFGPAGHSGVRYGDAFSGSANLGALLARIGSGGWFTGSASGTGEVQLVHNDRPSGNWSDNSGSVNVTVTIRPA